MIFPVEELLQENLTTPALGGAVVIGVAFGFVLERAGFGRAQKLVAQFYGTEMTVFRVMFTAVVTAMLGAMLLAAIGLLDLKAVSINYPTYLWPMIAGGLIVGVGFVTSGYCPGTSIVAAASGKLDGVFTVLGVVMGTLLYAEVQPSLGGFHESGKLGSLFLYQIVHLPPLVLALVIGLAAVLSYQGAGKIERLVNAARAAKAAPAATTQQP